MQHEPLLEKDMEFLNIFLGKLADTSSETSKINH